MSNQYFKFKQFTIRQEKTAMKVGTDGVLLGAWAEIANAESVLDVGTGTGLVAIMLAQRSDAIIDAIEIEKESAMQAKENVDICKWHDRITIYENAFQIFAEESHKKYDLIVSNPPYFLKSLKPETLARTVARHTDSLPHAELLKGIVQLLNKNGRFAGIFPYVEGNIFVALASTFGLYCNKRVEVHGKLKGTVKRVLLEFSKQKLPIQESAMAIRSIDDEYTQEYINLTKDFYLAF